MVGICCAWKVLFCIWCDEELVLAPFVLNCCCERFPGHSLMCVCFSPPLLLQWVAYCSGREVSFCWSVYSVQCEFSKDTFVSWCSWRSWFYRNGSVTWMFFSLWITAQLLCFPLLYRTRKDEIYVYAFLVLIPSSSRAWHIYYRWDVDKQWLERWLRQPASL